MIPVEIIAEAGLNHNGRLSTAYELANWAKACGADVVKFQNSVPELEATSAAPLAAYQENGRYKSQIEMIRDLVLSFDDTLKLAEYCKSIGIEFMSTPADPVSLQFLVDDCKMKRIKIGSDNLTNPQLLHALAAYRLPVILSTGMATMQEVAAAVGYLRCSTMEWTPITLMQCTSCYPANVMDANLAAIWAMRKELDLPVGFSDHTRGHLAAQLAVAAGAVVIEKHLTLDNSMEGPDHEASADPIDFRTYVDAIRETQQIMGDPVKRPCPAEAPVASAVRKSLVAARDIAAGEEFAADNIAVKRPGTGRSPWSYFDLIGKPAQRSYKQDEMIE